MIHANQKKANWNRFWAIPVKFKQTEIKDRVVIKMVDRHTAEKATRSGQSYFDLQDLISKMFVASSRFEAISNKMFCSESTAASNESISRLWSHRCGGSTSIANPRKGAWSNVSTDSTCLPTSVEHGRIGASASTSSFPTAALSPGVSVTTDTEVE